MPCSSMRSMHTQSTLSVAAPIGSWLRRLSSPHRTFPFRFAAGLLLALTCGPSSPASADERSASWPQFRGPSGQGASLATKVPLTFGLDAGLKWQTLIPGKGWSSPVVGNGHVWVTTAITTQPTDQQREARMEGVQESHMKEVAGVLELRAICLDFETGSVIHNLQLATYEAPEPIHSLNSYASPTPVLDDAFVYCHFGAYGTWCLREASGEVVWHQRLIIDHSVGPGGSPVVVDDHLLLVCDGIDVQFVAALDKSTGAEVWRTPRPAMRATNGEYKKAYSTPLIIPVAGQRQAVVPGAQWIVSYDPRTGEEIWRADHGNGFSISSTPVYTGTAEEIGLVIFTTGYGQSEVVAVRPDGVGDVTLTHVAWRMDRNVPEKPSPVVHDGLVYLLDDNGVLSCLRSDDASLVFRKRVPGNFSASPLLAAGHLFLCNQEGVVTVIKQGTQYDEVAKIQLDARLMASPAVAGDDLLFRSEQSIMRFAHSDD
ncbi:MAG: PQQ-binding-like beta-propeller repeat protein [Planctomycetaceae bacterium]